LLKSAETSRKKNAMSESERQEPVPEGTASAIPGRDDANPAERDVLEGEDEGDQPYRDPMGRATGSPEEEDVMGEPDPADPDPMGSRRPLPDETLGDDAQLRPEP
jgi:hypothetical protein